MKMKKCSKCKRLLPANPQLDINIDHDHSNGKIREVLCINCNIMIGNAKENPLILIKAIHYLRKHKSKPILKAKHKAKRNKINKLIFVNPFIDLTHFLKNDKKDEEDRIILISRSQNQTTDKNEVSDKNEHE